MAKPDLGNPQNTIEVLQKYKFNFQKKFGQNFLIDTHVLDKIIYSAEITKEDMVLEIGPGIGTMTQYLAEAAGKVIAVEIDKNLIPILADTLHEYENVQIINEDVLKLDIAKIVEEQNRLKWLRIFHIILRHRSLWDFLKIMFRFRALRSWYRKKWQTVCRPDRVTRITVLCHWRCNIMQTRTLLQMSHRTASCQDRR